MAINRFPTDTENEISKVQEVCKNAGVNAVLAEHWAEGGKGAAKLAEAVVETIESNTDDLKFLYQDEDKPKIKIDKICKEIYRANDVTFSAQAEKKIK